MVRTLSVFLCWFFTIIQFLSELFLIYAILCTHKLLKKLIIVKNPHKNTDNVLTIKFFMIGRFTLIFKQTEQTRSPKRKFAKLHTCKTKTRNSCIAS